MAESIDIKAPVSAVKDGGIRYDVKMPYTGAYGGYSYSVYKRDMDKGADGKPLVDEDGLCNIHMSPEKDVKLSNGVAKTTMKARDLAGVMSANPDDYNPGKKRNVEIELDESEVVSEKPGYLLFQIPILGDILLYISEQFLHKDETAGTYKISIPEDQCFGAVTDKGMQGITAGDLSDALKAAALAKGADSPAVDSYVGRGRDPLGPTATAQNPADIKMDKSDYPDKFKEGYRRVTFSRDAVVQHGENLTFFRMPKGKYQDASFVYPNANIVNRHDGSVDLYVKEDSPVTLARNYKKGNIQLTPQAFCSELSLRKGDEFSKEPPEANPIFAKEANIRATTPVEMLDKPNWVVVRKSLDERGNVVTDYINPRSGGFADSAESETWGSFDEAVKFAREFGGDSVAYALDGKDGICAVEQTAKKSKGFERSFRNRETFSQISEDNTVTRFYKDTPNKDYRSISRDGKTRLYREDRFIEMQGTGTVGTLKECRKSDYGCDALCAVGIRKEKEKRRKDQQVLTAAFNSSESGARFQQLYKGTGDHNPGDAQELMNRLAFWCDKDTDQMMRLYKKSAQCDAAMSKNAMEDMCVRGMQSVNYTASSHKAKKNYRENRKAQIHDFALKNNLSKDWEKSTYKSK